MTKSVAITPVAHVELRKGEESSIHVVSFDRKKSVILSDITDKISSMQLLTTPENGEPIEVTIVFYNTNLICNSYRSIVINGEEFIDPISIKMKGGTLFLCDSIELDTLELNKVTTLDFRDDTIVSVKDIHFKHVKGSVPCLIVRGGKVTMENTDVDMTYFNYVK